MSKLLNRRYPITQKILIIHNHSNKYTWAEVKFTFYIFFALFFKIWFGDKGGVLEIDAIFLY